MRLPVQLLERLQWRRGLRAALAVAAAILVCRSFGQPYTWAALGAFEAILVDNGGPYRSRLDTILTVLAGGAVAGLLGAYVGGLIFAPAGAPASLWNVPWAVLLSAAVCFGFTFARVINQPFASTSTIILVIFFSGLGSGEYHPGGGGNPPGCFRRRRPGRGGDLAFSLAARSLPPGPASTSRPLTRCSRKPPPPQPRPRPPTGTTTNTIGNGGCAFCWKTPAPR